jgi:hypothetical protein
VLIKLADLEVLPIPPTCTLVLISRLLLPSPEINVELYKPAAAWQFAAAAAVIAILQVILETTPAKKHSVSVASWTLQSR